MSPISEHYKKNLISGGDFDDGIIDNGFYVEGAEARIQIKSSFYLFIRKIENLY